MNNDEQQSAAIMLALSAVLSLCACMGAMVLAVAMVGF